MNNTFRPKRLTSYDDNSIINEIKRVVSKYFGDKTPTVRDFSKHSMIHYQTIIERFGSWANAMGKAGFKYRDSRSIDSQRLIEDLNITKKLSRGMYFTQDFYKKNGGKYSFTTLKKGLGCPNWEILLERVLHLKKAPKVIRIIKPKVKKKRNSLFTDERLFLELKRVWDSLGRRPLYMEFRKIGSIGTKVYERRFGSWTKAIISFYGKFGHDLLGIKGATATPEILLSELKILASQTSSRNFSFKNYKELGGVYSIGTFVNHFGSWKNALGLIGKALAHGGSHAVQYSDEELFQELQRIWEKLGRQPGYREMKQYGKISGGTLKDRFGGWTKAIHAFCSDRSVTDRKDTCADDPLKVQPSHEPLNIQEEALDTNRENIKANIINDSLETQLKKKPVDIQKENLEAEESYCIEMATSRVPSLRLRFQVFKRDNFRCVKCGRSPAITPDVELHIDHIKPYSKGGETMLDNLQTLCKDCNIGKSDIE